MVGLSRLASCECIIPGPAGTEMQFYQEGCSLCLSSDSQWSTTGYTADLHFVLSAGQTTTLTVTNDWSEARVDPLAALLIQGGGQTGKYQAVVSRAT